MAGEAGAGAAAFRLQCKTLFLTYSQVPESWTKSGVLAAVKEALRDVSHYYTRYSVGHELHKDGGHHYHVYVELGRKCNIRGPHALDIKIDDEEIHGNYRSGRKGDISYSQKDGDFLTNIYPDADYVRLARDGEVEEAVNLFLRAHPREAGSRGYLTIRQNLSQLAPVPAAPMPYFGPWNATYWNLTTGWDRAKTTLFMYGPTGAGKTTMARHLLPCALFVRNLNALKDWRHGTHNGIIYDDIDWSNFSREKILHILDVESDSQIRILYGIATVRAGTPRIITSNKEPAQDFPHYDEAAARRLHVVWKLSL